MKICVLGLDCAAPEIAFGDPRLRNLRTLMEQGVWGCLESVIPPITVPAWMCLSTGQDPGSLGVYGFRNRANYTYGGVGVTGSKTIPQPTIWDHISKKSQKTGRLGVAPRVSPRDNN